VEQNSTLKKDVAIAERKLLARNERISNLEILLTNAQEEITAAEKRFEKRYELIRRGASKGLGA
jgi:kinesin family protein 5